MTHDSAISYQLHIRIERPIRLHVGALGLLRFPGGNFVHTGSAKRSLPARVARHLRRDKALRWDIDYLLNDPSVDIARVVTSQRPECEWQQSVNGQVLHPGFGASDCRAGCQARLKWTGGRNPYTSEP